MSSSVEVIIADGGMELLSSTEMVTEVVDLSDAPISIVETTTGKQGPEGKQGESGGITFNCIAGETISALKVVYEDGHGRCFLASNNDENNIDYIIGVSRTAGNADDKVEVQRHGHLDITDLGFVAGRVYLGLNGDLTQLPPEDGFDVLVGYAVSDKRLYINLNDSILLDEV